MVMGFMMRLESNNNEMIFSDGLMDASRVRIRGGEANVMADFMSSWPKII